LCRFSAAFFTFGQLLPTQRIQHSPFGGLFQPTVTQAIRLLSAGPFTETHNYERSSQSPTPRQSFEKPDLADPFSAGSFTYTTDGHDVFPSPSAYRNRRHAWVHIFPEGKIHQAPDLHMRYFKWGIARMILEADPCPDVVPMWIEGMEQVMNEARQFPRFVPRIWGATISITYGAALDTEKVFGDLRDRWKRLYGKEMKRIGSADGLELGILTDELKYGKEAVKLREECTLRVRKEVLKLAKARGRSDEDPKWSLAETWRHEQGKLEGHMPDGSIVKDV
jgi:monolysocardiolipin acyltransferase